MISDFGLARTMERELSSRAGQVLRTPDYMAPKQLLGEPITTATDIYALGLVMYEMVVGAKAFPGGRTLENAVQRVVEKPAPPRSYSAEYQCRMERCLSRDPADRPASGMDVVAALGGQQLPPIKCLCTQTDLRQELAKRFRQLRNHVIGRPDLRLSTDREPEFASKPMAAK